MRLAHLTVVLFGSLAVGQTAPGPAPVAPPRPPAQPTGQAPASNVAPDAPVITIPGVCDTGSTRADMSAGANAPADKPKEECQTVITRAQFESLANALQPNMNPQTKRRLAELYPRLLVMAQEARKRGLENDPRYNEMVRFARLQILSQQLTLAMKEEADKVPDAEIEKYYKDNQAAFEQASLQRLFIPKEKQHPPTKADASAKAATGENPSKQAEAQKADEQAMQQVAESLRKRAAAGEDFEKLEKEAYAKAGITGTPPSTNIGNLGRNEIPVDQRAVLDLKAGDVSQLFTEPNGYYVYKVVSKETKSLDQARDEIRANLAQQRMQDSMARFQEQSQPTLNDAYFGPPSPSPGAMRVAPPGAPAPPPGTSRPPAPPRSLKPNSPAGPPQSPQK